MELIKETSKKITKALFYPENKKSLIPNWLSFSRLIGGITIPIIINKGASIKTIIKVTSFVALSDFLDGKIARTLKAESEDGALLDVISDKFFSIFLISGIIPNNKIFITNGLLEIIISGINANTLKNGGNPKSNLMGKIKIWPLSVAIAMGYISMSLRNNGITNISPDYIMNIASALSITTIPLELINIKDYYNNLKITKEKHGVLIYEKQKENKKEKNTRQFNI